MLSYAIVMEELARGYASVADQCGLVELISTLLVDGTDAQRTATSTIAQTRLRGACAHRMEAADLSNVKTVAVRPPVAV